MVSQQIGPVWFIQGENRGRYPYCNSVYVEEAGILIDPASDRQALLEIKGTKPVRQIWLSHWHEDHFMHLDLFEDVPLRISERDLPPLTGIETFLDWYGIENPEYRAFWTTLLKDQFHYSPRTADSFFLDHEIIALGPLSVEIIPTPGHTPGNVAFYFREPEILFLGDYDLTPFGPWYGDVYSDIDQTIASIRRLKAIPARVWLAGHEAGLFTQKPEELWTRYEEIIYERESKLLGFLSEPRTLDDITGAWIVYGRAREPKAFFEFGEQAIMKKHLERLKRNGQILQEGKYFARL